MASLPVLSAVETSLHAATRPTLVSFNLHAVLDCTVNNPWLQVGLRRTLAVGGVPLPITIEQKPQGGGANAATAVQANYSVLLLAGDELFGKLGANDTTTSNGYNLEAIELPEVAVPATPVVIEGRD